VPIFVDRGAPLRNMLIGAKCRRFRDTIHQVAFADRAFHVVRSGIIRRVLVRDAIHDAAGKGDAIDRLCEAPIVNQSGKPVSRRSQVLLNLID